jgi:hypothetical protein
MLVITYARKFFFLSADASAPVDDGTYSVNRPLFRNSPNKITALNNYCYTCINIFCYVRNYRAELDTRADWSGLQVDLLSLWIFCLFVGLFSGFLEPISNMLVTGMVPALFIDDEKEQICASVRNASNDAGFGVTRWINCFIIIHWPFI